ncbi:GNAT family N-acetyltransferase [Agaricicola taiwanensis]|nr:GNAT family N-acetyltransferase [Agaricicola taiwanensis]
MTPIIRLYRPDDLDGLIAVFLAAIRQTASKDYMPAQIDAWARPDRAIWAERRASRPTWVAEIGGRPAGFTDLEPDGHIDMLYVHPEFQRQGVAAHLLDRVESSARLQGLQSIYSEVSLTARPAFEKAGFAVVAPERVLRNGQWFDRFRVEKRLG